MNYIKALQNEIQETNANVAEQVERMTDFMAYLSSSKFHEDTTIQVWEVQKLLMEMRSALTK